MAGSVRADGSHRFNVATRHVSTAIPLARVTESIIHGDPLLMFVSSGCQVTSEGGAYMHHSYISPVEVNDAVNISTAGTILGRLR